MLRLRLSEAVFAAAVVAFMASGACARDFIAKLTGFEEIGSISATGYTGAILSNGIGSVSLELDERAVPPTIHYTLTYSNVGTTDPLKGTVRFAHIHFGKSRDSGGVLVFFCTNESFGGSGPPPPSCNTLNGSGSVSGDWTAQNVQAIAGQNVKAGDFNAVVQALNSNTAYANIHTTALPGGEIRGQCVSENPEDREDDN